MKHVLVVPLLTFALLPSLALAQRRNSPQSGGAAAGRRDYGAWEGTVVVGRGPLQGRGYIGPCGFGDCFERYGFRQGEYGGYGGYAGYFPGYSAPYFADDDFWSLRETPQPPPPPASTPTVIVQAPQQQLQQRAQAESPKLIEVSLDTDSKESSAPYAAPAQPAIFILSNGERLRATQYTLTYESLQLPQGRRMRVIPLSEVDLDATVAANRQQGFDLQIPANRQQITLGF